MCVFFFFFSVIPSLQPDLITMSKKDPYGLFLHIGFAPYRSSSLGTCTIWSLSFLKIPQFCKYMYSYTYCYTYKNKSKRKEAICNQREKLPTSLAFLTCVLIPNFMLSSCIKKSAAAFLFLDVR